MQNLAHFGAGLSDPILVAKSTETSSCGHGVYEIVLNGKPQLALPDNQASANIMSLKFAEDKSGRDQNSIHTWGRVRTLLYRPSYG